MCLIEFSAKLYFIFSWFYLLAAYTCHFKKNKLQTIKLNTKYIAQFFRPKPDFFVRFRSKVKTGIADNFAQKYVKIFGLPLGKFKTDDVIGN